MSSSTPVFSTKAQDATLQAERAAVQYGHTAVRPEHLLLGILRAGDGRIDLIFRRQGADPEALARELDYMLRSSPTEVSQGAQETAEDARGRLYLSTELKQVIAEAGREARDCHWPRLLQSKNARLLPATLPTVPSWAGLKAAAP